MAPGIPTLDADRESLSTLREFWFQTLARLMSEEPHTSAYIPAYTAFGTKLDARMVKETALRDAVALAEAKAIAADRVLNTLLDKLSTLIHGGKQPDVTLPQHQLYFGKEAPHDARRPILGPQLDLMAAWPNKLAKETQQGYLDLIAPLDAALQNGFAARNALNDARADNAEFRLTGERRQVFDEYNALASTTYGALAAFAHDHPELSLPSDWARSCFRAFSRDAGPQTVEECDTLLAKLHEQVGALDQKRAALVKEAQDQASADAEAEKAAADLEAAEEAEKAAKKAKKEAAKKAKAAKKKAKK